MTIVYFFCGDDHCEKLHSKPYLSKYSRQAIAMDLCKTFGDKLQIVTFEYYWFFKKFMI